MGVQKQRNRKYHRKRSFENSKIILILMEHKLEHFVCYKPELFCYLKDKNNKLALYCKLGQISFFIRLPPEFHPVSGQLIW